MLRGLAVGLTRLAVVELAGDERVDRPGDRFDVAAVVAVARAQLRRREGTHERRPRGEQPVAERRGLAGEVDGLRREAQRPAGELLEQQDREVVLEWAEPGVRVVDDAVLVQRGQAA